MFCAISGKTPEEPVVSSKSGHVFEKSLIEKWLEANNGMCPITQQPLAKTDLIEVKVNKSVVPRPTTATSIPAMLSLFQNEWDAVMLETFTLKQQLESVRQELAHSMYQHDAACRVIARLIKERDESRNMLANLKAQIPTAQVAKQESTSESMEVESGISEDIKQKLTIKSQELAKERKKRPVPDTLASTNEIKDFDVTYSVNLHKTTSPGIHCVDLHPTKQHLVLTGGADGDLILFDRHDNKILHTMTGHSKNINAVQFHPTRDMVFSASSDKTAKIWTAESSWKSAQTIKVHSAKVVGCSVHATGDYWITASLDKSWALHDIATSQTLCQIPSESGFTCVQFHPDGIIVGTGNEDSHVKIWDVKAQKNVATFEGHKGKLTDLTFSENGYYLATAAEDNTIKLWDLRKLKNIQSISLPDNFHTSSVEFDYSGTYLSVTGNDIRVYAGKTFTEVGTFGKHSGVVTDMKWGKDAHNFVTVSMDRALKVWGKRK